MSVDVNIDEVDDSALPATSDTIDWMQTRDRRGAKPTVSGSSPTKRRTRKNDGPGFEIGDAELPPALPESPISMPSETPPSILSRPWRTPQNVRELAGQANQVATLVLRGEIDLEVARTYGSIVRGIAQMMSIEVTRARFLRTEPILDLENPEDD